jgi:hypothetical protein
VIGHLVAGDRQEPRRHRSISLRPQALDRACCRDQGFLNHIVEVWVIAAEPHRDEPVNHREVSFEQRIESLTIPILRSFNQLIGRGHSGGV